MKNPAEEAKARTSMSSTFGSVMNPDGGRDFKLSLDQVIKQRKQQGYLPDDSDDDGYEIVSLQNIILKQMSSLIY